MRLPKTVIWEAWCLNFGTLGTIFALWGHLEGPREKQEGREGIRNQIVIDLGSILGPYFKSFLDTDAGHSGSGGAAAAAGPMIPEKQTASEIRSRGAPKWETGGLAKSTLLEFRCHEEVVSWRGVAMVCISLA